MINFIAYLLENGTKANYFNRITKSNSISLAKKNNQPEILKLLLGKHVNTSEIDSRGETFLHILIEKWEKISVTNWDKYFELLRPKLTSEMLYIKVTLESLKLNRPLRNS